MMSRSSNLFCGVEYIRERKLIKTRLEQLGALYSLRSIGITDNFKMLGREVKVNDLEIYLGMLECIPIWTSTRIIPSSDEFKDINSLDHSYYGFLEREKEWLVEQLYIRHEFNYAYILTSKLLGKYFTRVQDEKRNFQEGESRLHFSYEVQREWDFITRGCLQAEIIGNKVFLVFASSNDDLGDIIYPSFDKVKHSVELYRILQEEDLTYGAN